MPDAASATSLLHELLGLQVAPAGPEGNNRLTLEGLSVSPLPEGGLAVSVARLEAASLRVASGSLAVEIARLEVRELTARGGAIEAAHAEFAGLKIEAPLALSGSGAPSSEGPWCLGPLAAADGRIGAEIVDAHLMFDADVSVPIREGRIDFNHATVEHVGPDSRMGVSRMGLYVDAPNGRSYLYQFPSAPVAGVQYEKRGALPVPWSGDRGQLELQPFGESMLRQPRASRTLGFTEQSRALLHRTAVSGSVQLGDGTLCIPGVRAEMQGRAEGRNAVRLHSERVGRGITAEMAGLALRNVEIAAGPLRLACAEVVGSVVARVTVDGGTLRMGIEIAKMKVSGMRLARG